GVNWLHAPDYWLGRLLFLRTLAGIYLIAFLVALQQFRPLLGDNGLLPIVPFVRAVPFRRAPSLFYWRQSDAFAATLAAIGALLALAALAGLADVVPAWAALAIWLALWALYQSFVNVGQIFYGFGWETLLLEAGLLAAFAGPANIAPRTAVII